MELKFGNIKMEYDATNSSNRTFMELKLDAIIIIANFTSVLIAPLWN